MISVNEFTAWITVDDNILQEYDVKVSPETNTVVCWIPSEAGKGYSVHWRNDRFRAPTAGYVYVDGTYCAGKTIESGMYTTARADGITTSPTTLKPFAFSTVKVTDDTGFLSTPDTPEMGEIKISIRNVQIQGTSEFRPVSVPVTKTYHETAKKGLNHQTSFQDERKVPLTRVVKTVPIGGPAATLLFKYRPLAMLQATGIAPRPPPQRASPSPQPPSRNNSRASSSKKRPAPTGSDGEDVKPDITLSLSDDDDGGSDADSRKLQELQNQMNAIRAKRKKIKTEKKPKVKAEKIQHLGTIDLTLDD